MRQDIYSYIVADTDMHKFLRMNPIWYRKLTRNPDLLSEFQTECSFFFRKSIPDRVDKFSSGIQIAQLMMSMFQSKTK